VIVQRRMYRVSKTLTLQLLSTVTCWFLSTPVLPNAVRRSTGELRLSSFISCKNVQEQQFTWARDDSDRDHKRHSDDSKNGTI